MNKLSIHTIALCFVLILSQNKLLTGQSNGEKLFRIGLKVSPNYTWVKYKTTNYINNGNYFGTTFGFVSDYLISDDFLVETGIDFTGIRLKYSQPHCILKQEGILERSVQVNYFEIPIALKYIVHEFRKISINAQAGFKFGFNYRAKSDEIFYYYDSVTGAIDKIYFDKVKINEEIASLKMSLIFGVGTECPINDKLTIFCAFLFNPGVTNILSGFNNLNTNLPNKANSSNIELSIGILFNN